MRGIFISGTGTDVGKTVCTAALLRALRLADVAAQAVKPVQTGVAAAELYTSPHSDACVYRTAAADLPSVPDLPSAVALRSYPLPASPHLAAADEGKRLEVRALQQEICAYWKGQNALLLLEGAGGLHTPLNEREDMIDLMVALDLPVLLVARNCLGALNEIFLSLSALRMHGLTPFGLVLVPAVNADNTRILNDNLETLRARLAPNGCPALALPRETALDLPAWQRLAERLAPFADKIKGIAAQEQDKKTTLVERDKRAVWHPYASALRPPLLDLASRTSGNHIILDDGRELVDGMSSWWAAIHGYNHPRLLAALQSQAGRMPHVMFGGLTHAPAVELAERLLALMPQGLERVFFADSGSVAVEAALKMSLQYQQGLGQKNRTRFLAPRGGYHGDTFGAMSVCDPVTGMHGLFRDMLPQHLFTAKPACRFDAPYASSALDETRILFDLHGQEIAAVILEPVVQGAGGMYFYHPDYLRGLAELCRAAGALLIFDEIATGFGRTGKFFAAEWAGITPDILCCGKALTGGMLTLAACACTGAVACGVCRDNQIFMHGPTFMANALACAVANASLDILAENVWPGQVAEMEAHLRAGLEVCRGLPEVADVRVLGGIGVVEMQHDVNTQALHAYFVRHGVWLRPFNRLIYLMPPYITPAEDVRILCAAIEGAIRAKIYRA
ncbi:MAG: adenosylmethionine--8-amino-7-oxononanoate transaminase [Desulfovibrio sp.]|nr:adenosylmethionine--8-amino-7-oxononanoate transaminase [Desulfovibrio sp.]